MAVVMECVVGGGGGKLRRRKGSVNGRVPVQCDDDDTSAS